LAPYTILVEFLLRDGALPRFLELIRTNAAASLDTEPGCERFDVLVPEGERNRVILYEIYKDGDAFAVHSRQPHYDVFAQAAESLVKGKRVTVLESVNEDPADSAAGTAAAGDTTRRI
jgi:(4S)-4-hydroxy-5-phosphonooxypentane-2,3-dione isomerase